MIVHQYYIGISKRSKDLIFGLMDLGCTLMFYFHPKTLELNLKYRFYEGEWLLVTCSSDSEIDEIKRFLEQKASNDSDLEFEIIPYQSVNLES